MIVEGDYMKRSPVEVIADEWEVLPAKASKRTDSPALSLQKNGRISWNEGAQRAMGDPDFVELLLNRRTGRLGLRKVEKSEQAFHVRKSGSQRTWALSAEGALNQAGIKAEVAYRRYADVSNGVVSIDISELLKQ
jgi:hypothetical protein